MGVLNRKKSGAAGAANGAEFFSAGEASQLNTLLRGAAPGTSTGEGEGGSGGSALHSGAGDEARSDDAKVRAAASCVFFKRTAERPVLSHPATHKSARFFSIFNLEFLGLRGDVGVTQRQKNK